jgi:methanogenic corrinoid protein MtbC1
MEREILDNLTKAVIQCDVKAAAQWAQKATDEGVDPIKGLDALTEAIRQVAKSSRAAICGCRTWWARPTRCRRRCPSWKQRQAPRRIARNLGVVVIGTVGGDITPSARAWSPHF